MLFQVVKPHRQDVHFGRARGVLDVVAVFLLSSAKEHWDRTSEPQEAMVNGMAHSGRVIFAAAAVMVAVFLPSRSPDRCPPRRWASSSASPFCSTPPSCAFCCSRHY
jgi:hypothetical protein